MNIVLSSICLETCTDIQLALYYLKAYLLQHCCALPFPRSISVCTFSEHRDASDIAAAILRARPRIVGFSCYVWNIEATLSVCRALKKRTPSVGIVLGGPEVTPAAGEILAAETSVDIVVRGEGEKTFAQCVERIARNRGLSRVKGISYRDQGHIIHNPDRTDPVPLRTVPSPYLSGIIDLGDRKIIDVPLETSRGCSYRCGYCFYHKNFPRVRFFSLRKVEDELKLILSRNPREVYLMDATFNLDRRRAKDVLRLFIKYNRGSTLHIELKAEFVDEEMALLLRRARAFNIEIGIQSTNAKTLAAVNRIFDREQFMRGIGLLNKYGLLYEIQLIDALPHQSYADLKRSLDWLYGLRPVKVVIFPLSLLPGTALRSSACAFGITYSARPPYHAYKSNAMSAADLRRVGKLRIAMERLYDSQVFQKALFELRDKAGIRITDVFEDWISWTGTVPGVTRLTPDGFNRKLPEFLKYVLKKRGVEKSFNFPGIGI